MERLLIIADDFTGANDTGVQLKKRGIDTSVVFDADCMKDHSRALVIDTESRGLNEQEAYSRVFDICSRALDQGFDFVYKKVDSTLRGNIASEIGAINNCYKPEIIVFAPAYPDNGRTTVNGVQRLDGVPISRTEIARDPKKPVKEDNIINLLKNGLNENVIHVGSAVLRYGCVNLSGSKVFTFDAEEKGDLSKVVEAVLNVNRKTLWVGSAGLADAILQVVKPARPVLSVVGSVSDVSREQVNFAVSKGAHVVRVPVASILETGETAAVVEEAANVLKKGKDVILVSSLLREDYNCAVSLGEMLGLNREDVSVYTQNVLGDITKKVIEAVKVEGMFLTGGDTAVSVIGKLNARGSSIIQELLTGIPLMKLLGGQYDGMKVVTKAGAFGKVDALEYCINKIKEDL